MKSEKAYIEEAIEAAREDEKGRKTDFDRSLEAYKECAKQGVPFLKRERMLELASRRASGTGARRILIDASIYAMMLKWIFWTVVVVAVMAALIGLSIAF